MKKLTLSIFILLLVIFAYIPVGANIWHIFTGRGFIIPSESSIFTFRPTIMNEGSGEWWLYGRDGKFYYHFIGTAEISYIKISKDEARKCEGFDANNYKTWCLTEPDKDLQMDGDSAFKDGDRIKEEYPNGI